MCSLSVVQRCNSLRIPCVFPVSEVQIGNTEDAAAAPILNQNTQQSDSKQRCTHPLQVFEVSEDAVAGNLLQMCLNPILYF